MIAKYGKFEYVLAEHYRFEDELGRGAMGTVYRAQDVRLGRPVAIKMLHPMLTNELGVARFQSEIRIAAGLHHPNIIGVHDSGEADGRLFFVMDYLGGETLRDRLKREKQLSVEDALRITEQVADGLQYAHDHGVVHRDVKPENILLAEGSACVVDFGLARALEDVDTDRLTASGLSVGTPHYLSPEQAAAEKDVGPKADQYALGCVLYEMLVGEPPFTGPTATSIAMRHISEVPRPLRFRRHTTPIAVEVAVMRAMEKVPADRFASVKEFSRAWANPGGHVGSLASADSETPSGWRRLRRAISGRTMAAILVFVGLALVMAAYIRQLRESSLEVLHGPIRVALLPLVAATSVDSTRATTVLGSIVGELRLFGGIVGVVLPSPKSAEDAESDPGAAITTARRRGARYVTLLAGFRDREAGLGIELLDTQTGEAFGREHVMPGDSDDPSLGADVAVSIARSIASRDSLFARAFRSLLRSTNSARALSHLVEGQRRFGANDIAGASAEYRRAIVADSSCLLALYRLSVMASWNYHFDDALAIADSGLRLLAGSDDRMTRLFRAQRSFAMRIADSAIAGFAASVADDPDNVDGWFGLAQSMYYFGWVAGYSIGDARTALDRVLYLDSTFAPVHGQLVDVALASGDTAAARAALHRIDVALPWRQAKALLVRYASGGPASRDTVFRELDRSDQFTLSELVLQFSRLLGDLQGADRVAVEMQSPRRSPESRRRGAQYRLALSVPLGRAAEATRVVVAGRGGEEFDSWLAAAALSGVASNSRASLRKAAWTIVPRRLTADMVSDPASRLSEAIDFLVQDALDDPSGRRSESMTKALEILRANAHGANPSIPAWKESLGARIALTRGDTLAAIAALKRATRRVNEPYGAFIPLVSLPMQRQLLVKLLTSNHAPSALIVQAESSFRRSWSIADALFVTESTVHAPGRSALHSP